ncbi:MAG: DUF2851 family protein [Bacteroidales bacterium]|nr:DUF2851 family protein [Bacteroidales bacterium]MDD2203896.1 DUF2851 family protein [Bacteroidales bacterium]MDD3913089.1 DUF2851 family protein [Bacteroidales bacterium]MDD4633004.1 DUF2851 family protein [Bacteroidales bacterium]
MINENLLAFIWQQRVIQQFAITVDGKKVSIINPGTLNSNQGPDFINSQMIIDNTLWYGNVEIHVKSSDWFLHCHQLDANYANVICHVVWLNDATVCYLHGDAIPTIELSKLIPDFLLEKYNDMLSLSGFIACQNNISNVPKYIIFNMLETAFFESLETKLENIHTLSSNINNNFDELCYKLIIRNFGFRINNDAFEATADSLPQKFVRKYSDRANIVDALFFGQANMLNEHFKDDYPKLLFKEYKYFSKLLNIKPQISCRWKYMRIRPANFPCIRMSQCAAFMQKNFNGIDNFLTIDSLQDYYKLFGIPINDYWQNHIVFDKKTNTEDRRIGISSIDIILINTILPLIFFYGKAHNNELLCNRALSIFENISAENNKIIRQWKNLNVIPKNAMHSQALLYLKQKYCDNKFCLKCKIGAKILTD